MSRFSSQPKIANPAKNRWLALRLRQTAIAAGKLAHLSNHELQEHASQLRELISAQHNSKIAAFFEKDVSNLCAGVALIHEAVGRQLGKSFYEVQMIGGLNLARGRIAQMQTGEGKTLTTAIPAFLFSLFGQGVHIATTNAYLAMRDSQELRPAFELLGLSVGILGEKDEFDKKRQAYAADITFGTGYDFGFDFLRDQLALRQRANCTLRPGLQHQRNLLGRGISAPKLIQRGQAFAIVDEADSVLVDEATMPLVLSSGANDNADPELYHGARRVALSLDTDQDFEIDQRNKTIDLTDSGWQISHDGLEQIDISLLARPWVEYVRAALRAEHLLERDVHYVVIDDTIQIVDQHTGRIHAERTWKEGLHQSIEAKEGVTVTPENLSDARATRQRYFQLYQRMCGMTGTTMGIERELKAFYGLQTSCIPTRLPGKREIWTPRIFTTSKFRDRAIAIETRRLKSCHRPLLIGTRTILHSHQLSKRFSNMGLSHAMLNGVQDAEEADVIGVAGRGGAVTLATNMAGRGTDIALDKQSRAAGGLHVIVAEPNPTRRVDRQLIGRAARQGDPGSCQFFVSLEDELVLHDETLNRRVIAAADPETGEANFNVTQAIDQLQINNETRQHEQRRAMVARDHWLDDILRTLAGTKLKTT